MLKKTKKYKNKICNKNKNVEENQKNKKQKIYIYIVLNFLFGLWYAVINKYNTSSNNYYLNILSLEYTKKAYKKVQTN